MLSPLLSNSCRFVGEEPLLSTSRSVGRWRSRRLHALNIFRQQVSNAGSSKTNRVSDNVPESREGRSSSDSKNASRTIFSGIQPTGTPHLGNYLGALREWVRLQNSSPPSDNFYFSVVDLHSLTSHPQTPAQRREAKRLTLASLLAAGLSPERCTLFYQSDVPQHAELHWILSCGASMGSLARMTQWRSKLSEGNLVALMTPTPNPKSEERLRLGLFTYPLLQAADILLYGATHVPVGEDQVAHLEFARAAANGFNFEYAGTGNDVMKEGQEHKTTRTLLVPPETIVSPSRRVMSLLEPEKKMSKSHENEKSRILISDSEEVIRKKFRSALTDSIENVTYEPEARPGVANLLEIIAHLDGVSRSPGEVAQDFQNMSVEGSIMRVLKERAIEVVNKAMEPIREELVRLSDAKTESALDEIAEYGRERASMKAEKTMKAIRQAVGI